jgi:predicted permease
MKSWRELRSFLRNAIWRSAAESEMDAEIRFHIEARAEDFVRSGLARSEALRRARLEFGAVDKAKEECRESRGAHLIENLRQDTRYGLRMLRKSPGSTAAVVLALALGIGLNTAVFGFVNALLLRPPNGIAATSQLRELWLRERGSSGVEGYRPLSYPDYIAYRDQTQSFAGLLAFDGDPEEVTWTRNGSGQVIDGQLVSGNFFSQLDVKPALGRLLAADDDRVGSAHPVAVVSHAFWQQQLGADPNIVGRELLLNGNSVTVVGVAPPGFSGLLAILEPAFWSPLSMTPQILRGDDRLTSRNTSWLIAVGRLREGATAASAQAEMNVIGNQLALAHPEDHTKTDPVLYAATAVPGPYRGYVAAFTGLLMVVFTLLLLVACANSAGLLLARATARAREMAIRTALGASRGRLIRQMLAESILLAVIAGAAGLAVAWWTTSLLMKLIPEGLPIVFHVPLDWRVLTFTLGISVVTGTVFGLAPALRGTKVADAAALQEGAQSASASVATSRVRSALMICQIASCVVLAIGAALCVKSLRNANSIDVGFDTQHVALAIFNPRGMGYSDQKIADFYARLSERVAALPGVVGSSYVHHLPLGGAREQRSVLAGEHFEADAEGSSVDVYRVAPNFFSTMQVPILRGRDFSTQESHGEAHVAVVNAAMAAQLFGSGGADAVGQRVTFIGDSFSTDIIGVVKTGKYRTLGEETIPAVYLPQQETMRTLVVRTSGDPSGLLDPIRAGVQAIDPAMAPTELETMQQYMTFPLFPARVAGMMLGACGFLAMLLTAIGLFGVISYIVSQRTHEIGIRVALGARPADVVRLVVAHGLLVTCAGLAIGLAAAFAGTRVLSSLLYGVRPHDAATLIGVSLAVTAVALAACYLPARRAMRVDPLTALRHD